MGRNKRGESGVKQRGKRDKGRCSKEKDKRIFTIILTFLINY